MQLAKEVPPTSAPPAAVRVLEGPDAAADSEPLGGGAPQSLLLGGAAPGQLPPTAGLAALRLLERAKLGHALVSSCSRVHVTHSSKPCVHACPPHPAAAVEMCLLAAAGSAALKTAAQSSNVNPQELKGRLEALQSEREALRVSAAALERTERQLYER